MLIARLIADPATLETRMDAAQAALADADMPVASAEMLAGNRDVLHIELPHGDRARLLDILDDHFAPCDVLASETEIRIPHLFVSDMDSTMIGQECIDELGDFAGLKDTIAAITEKAMRGEIDFEAALRERVRLLKGLEEAAIERCLSERIVPMEGAKTLIATLRDKGCRTVLVTGGFHHFADPVAERLGFDRVVGNRLAVVDGELTGELAGSISDASTKLATLEEERERLGAEAIVMAAGDGANDIPMMEVADIGIAYRAKPKARAAANGRIDRGDLTAILKLFDIPRAEWVLA